MNFDLAATPLHMGVSRLEASAGTGKTFTLAGLFLRLLLEYKVSPREILVVTFTEAATAELRDRIRLRLSEALAVLEGQPTEDALLARLAGQTQSQRKAAVASLRNAIEVFDLVSIHTIHGFCQRTLQDSAFESGILFDMELVPDQENLIRKTAADYCRRQWHGGDELMASVVLQAKLDPDVLARLLRQYLTYPDLELVTVLPTRPTTILAQEIRAGYQRCLESLGNLETGCRQIADFFLREPKWAVKEHAKRETIEHHAASLQTSVLGAGFWDAVDFFSISAVRRDTGKGKHMPSPTPCLFEHCETLSRLIDEYTTAHRLAFLRAAREELGRAKQEAKQQSYDDLISRVASALESPSGAALARSVRRRYRAALIDESQDTDPLQWKIFERVFASSQDHWLYLIGDPKQAIYAFRGADVNTYLQAAATAQHAYSLGTNWRSESALVGAVNALFGAAGENTAFLQEGIDFEPAQPGPRADSEPLSLDRGQRLPPFQVWCWEETNGTVSTGAAQRRLPGVVATEISRLLRNDSQLGRRRLQPRDMAILVESHRQARWMQSALHDLGIPSVEQATESVFDSDEARELQWILAAILTPGREAAVKSALTTDTLGLNATRLLALTAEETAWQARLRAFAEYHQAWEQHGVFSMFMQLFRQEHVIENLLCFRNAERRITNLLHLAELLETTSKAEHLGPSRLAQWLEERRNAHATAAEAHQLRLESDEDAVQIVTIHRAKGLEYPIVFCPFVSKDAKLRQIQVRRAKVMDLVLCHDETTGKLIWDLSPIPDQARVRLATREQLAEKIRLLYVALTRARNRCYLVSARYTRNKSTALAWLLRRSHAVPDNPVEILEADPVVPGEGKSRWLDIAATATDQCGGRQAIAVNDLPTEEGAPWVTPDTPPASLQARSCARSIEPSWFFSSFSSLAGQVSSRLAATSESGLPDHDEFTAPLEPEAVIEEAVVSGTGMFALPAGARTGDCLHRILERFDFENPSEETTQSLIRDELEASHLSSDTHAAAVAEMLERLRRVPLDPGIPNLTLARVPTGQRLTELEFHFPTARLDAGRILGLIRSPRGHGGEVAAPVSMTRPRAFLKGYLDLVFGFEGRYYIIDWKSNLLGQRTEDYSREAMKDEILLHCYDLQYHIYTLALDEFLRRRVPGYDFELHFGGVYYIFLRGLDSNRPELGVFHDRPTAETIHDLASILGTFAGARS